MNPSTGPSSVRAENCSTCEGTGTVHMEHQRGAPGSGGDFPCPDCSVRAERTEQ